MHLIPRNICHHHADDADHANNRVHLGKDIGPYCRFALDGSYEGNPDTPFKQAYFILAEPYETSSTSIVSIAHAFEVYMLKEIY